MVILYCLHVLKVNIISLHPFSLFQCGFVGRSFYICHSYYYYYFDFLLQSSFESSEHVHCSWSDPQLSALAIQVDSTPIPQHLMPLRPTYLHLLILLRWANSPHMTQTSPPQQQVSLSSPIHTESLHYLRIGDSPILCRCLFTQNQAAPA